MLIRIRVGSCTSSSRRLPDPLLPPSSTAGVVRRDLDEPRAPAGTCAYDRARVCGGAGTHGDPHARIAGRRGGRALALHTAAAPVHLAAQPCVRALPLETRCREPPTRSRCALPAPGPAPRSRSRAPHAHSAPPTGTALPAPSPMCFGGVGVLEVSRNSLEGIRGSVGIWSFLFRFEIFLIHLFTGHQTDIQSRGRRIV